MDNKCTILVAGDIVWDTHLYVAPLDDLRPEQAQPTFHGRHRGGAALTWKLLRATAEAQVELKAKALEAKAQAEKKAETTQQEKDMAKAQLEEDKKRAAYPIALAPAATRGNADGTATQTVLTSYGVWTPQPARAQRKDQVWRVSTQGGYGPLPGWESAYSDKTDTDATGQADGTEPDLLVLDDGSLNFRYFKPEEHLWPDLTKPRRIVLKHSAPLCRGNLWAELRDRHAGRLTVVVKADDLRREDALISQRLSWEQTVVDTLRVLDNHALLKELALAATLVVTFGDAGALCVHGGKDGVERGFLVFHPAQMEGEYATDDAGWVYGYQSCMAAALAYQLAPLVKKDATNPDAVAVAVDNALKQAIRSGLQAQRKLHDLGHGPITAGLPGFPMRKIGETIAVAPPAMGCVDVSPELARNAEKADAWSILEQLEPAPEGTQAPMAGLAKLVARYGPRAMDTMPSLTIGRLFSVDRREIETLRAVERCIRQYETGGPRTKPLSIAVFGPPGAGKSFGVKAIAGKVLKGSGLLEFNLSQFADASALVGAFHQVRDLVLTGKTPVVFWDEFDSGEYKWLQYLLAPMQDGSFQEGQITHPIGKCVFVFAGGTSDTLEEFGPPPLPAGDAEGAQDVDATAACGNGTPRVLKERHAKFKLLKGPDFVSRLQGYLNVLGPNPRKPRKGIPQPDRTYPIRRALMLRVALGANSGDVLHADKPGDVLRLDGGLLHALLTVPRYSHGARSLDRLVNALKPRGEMRVDRSSMPARHVLERDVGADAFMQLMNQRDVFKSGIDIEALAKLFHCNFLKESRENGWPINQRYDCPYEKLDADGKSANRGSALRVPELLELIDYRLERVATDASAQNEKPLTDAIALHWERLAQAEHLGWMDERMANGWRYGEPRSDEGLHHPSLVDWAQLSITDQSKDRFNVGKIPAVLQQIGFRAVPG